MVTRNTFLSRGLALVAVCASLVFAPPRARADTPADTRVEELQRSRSMIYAATSAELTLLASLAMVGGMGLLVEQLGGKGANVGSDLGLLIPVNALLFAISAGYAAETDDWDARYPLAAHGALWGAAAGGGATMLALDMTETQLDPLALAGVLALTTTLGAATAGLAGYTLINTDLAVTLWYAVPLAVTAAGAAYLLIREG